jgi:hypothetical protein
MPFKKIDWEHVILINQLIFRWISAVLKDTEQNKAINMVKKIYIDAKIVFLPNEFVKQIPSEYFDRNFNMNELVNETPCSDYNNSIDNCNDF